MTARTMYAVMVKPNARRCVCWRGKFWVKDDKIECYVSIRERGLWPTREDDAKAITERWETVVEVVVDDPEAAA